MKNANYFVERNLKNSNQLKLLLFELPSFCDEYFRGIENTTTPLTRVGYAQDLKIFFEFLTKEILEFIGKKVKLESITRNTKESREKYPFFARFKVE